ncbi:transposase (plasmid) [Levilactobacillus brevis]|nr:transposase [Levilactobacillus brevis]
MDKASTISNNHFITVDCKINPNSVRINFTIYLLTFIRNRDRATLQQLVMNYRPNGTEMDTVIRTIQKNYLGIRNACLYDYSNGPLEGINRKIKELKRSCYGFSNLRHFFIRIKLINA